MRASAHRHVSEAVASARNVSEHLRHVPLASSAVGSLVSCLGLAAGGRHLGIPAISPAGQEPSRLTAPVLAPARHRYSYRRTYAGPSPDTTMISRAHTQSTDARGFDLRGSLVAT